MSGFTRVQKEERNDPEYLLDSDEPCLPSMSVLQLDRGSAEARVVEPPPDRGRLLTAKEVAEMVGRSEAWVRRNMPYKIRLGHSTVRWYEHDVLRHVEGCRDLAQ
ncbi:helix-turn-helix transcriptional regulator [Gemmatimonadota bacterium]